METIEQLERDLEAAAIRDGETPAVVGVAEGTEIQTVGTAPKTIIGHGEVKHGEDVAYRTETSLLGIVREALSREDDGRALLQNLFRQAADLHPDESRGQLEVCVHPFSPLAATARSSICWSN